jgi:hypothetical protein
MKTLTTLQKAGGMCAIVAAATYLFAMGLAFTVLGPMTDPGLPFGEYMGFLTANRALVHVWHLVMYLVNGACLTVVVLAIRERLMDSSPNLSRVASAFGFTWVAFVFLSGVIVNFGTGALITLFGKAPGQAESLRNALDTITLGIDSSDKLLGCLWVGLVGLAALRNREFPRTFSIFGMLISAIGLVGTLIPGLESVSYLFGIGAIAWWLAVGIAMVSRPALPARPA